MCRSTQQRSAGRVFYRISTREPPLTSSLPTAVYPICCHSLGYINPSCGDLVSLPESPADVPPNVGWLAVFLRYLMSWPYPLCPNRRPPAGNPGYTLSETMAQHSETSTQHEVDHVSVMESTVVMCWVARCTQGLLCCCETALRRSPMEICLGVCHTIPTIAVRHGQTAPACLPYLRHENLDPCLSLRYRSRK